MLPGGSGFDVCRRIREHSDVPRAVPERARRGRGQAARARARRRRLHRQVGHAGRGGRAREGGPAPQRRRATRAGGVYGRFAVDRDAHEVTADGRPVALTAREFELLALFMDHPRQVLTREQIYERVWGSWGDRSAVAGLRAAAAREARAGADRHGLGRRLPVRSAMRSLRTWLALGLVAAIVAPAAARARRVGPGAATGRPRARSSASTQAVDVASAARTSTDWEALSGRADAHRRRGRAHRDQAERCHGGSRWTGSRSSRPPATGLVTPGLEALSQAPDFKQHLLERLPDRIGLRPGHRGHVFVAREQRCRALGDRARRRRRRARRSCCCWRSRLLQRWVLRPLARLAAGAEQIAGGELAIEPVATRAREVAQVGDAMSGMAGALERALGTRDRRRARAALPADGDRPRPAHAAVHAARVAGGDRARHRRRARRSPAPRTRPRTSTASSATCSRSRAPSTRARRTPASRSTCRRSRAARRRRSNPARCGSTSSPTGPCRSTATRSRCSGC